MITFDLASKYILKYDYIWLLIIHHIHDFEGTLSNDISSMSLDLFL